MRTSPSRVRGAELRIALWDRAPGFVRVCPAGVDVEAFGPALRSDELRSRLLTCAGGSSGSTLLFYAGRLSPEKNVGLLVDTLRVLLADRNVDYRLVLAGDGPRADWLRAQGVGELEGRIAFCGNLDRATLAACYASCDVFIHPNPREPFGIGPLEAMASGVPVVVPNAGGVLEYATNANAWLAAARGPSRMHQLCGGSVEATRVASQKRWRLALRVQRQAAARSLLRAL